MPWVKLVAINSRTHSVRSCHQESGARIMQLGDYFTLPVTWKFTTSCGSTVMTTIARTSGRLKVW